MKKTMIGILIALMALALSSIAYAGAPTCSVISPTGDVTGSQLFNVTVSRTAMTGGGNVTAVNFSTTADSNFCTEVGVNQSSYNCTFNTASLTETASTTLTATIYVNTTSLVGGTCTATIGIDNTDPTCTETAIVPENGLRTGGQLSFDVTASDTTTLTYSTVLTLDNGETQTLTGASNVFSGAETNGVGEATVVTTVTDGVSKTAVCPTVTTLITSDDGTSPVIIDGEDGSDDDKNNNLLLIIIFAVVVLIIIGIVATGTKGKKKRK